MKTFLTQKCISYEFLKHGRVLDAHFWFLIGHRLDIWSCYVSFVLVYIKCVFVLDAIGTRQLGGATVDRCYVYSEFSQYHKFMYNTYIYI